MSNAKANSKKVSNSKPSRKEQKEFLFDRSCRIVIRWGFCLLVGLTPLIIVPQMSESAITPKFIYSEVLLLILTSLVVVQIIKNGIFRIQRNFMYLPLLVFAVVYFIPSLFGEMPRLSFLTGLPTLFWLCGYFALVSTGKDDKLVRWLIVAVIAGGIIPAIYGLMQYSNLDFLHLKWEGREMEGKGIMISTFGNTNFFGAYMVPILLLIITWGILTTKNIILRFINIVLVTIFIGSIILSGVRSAWVATLVTMVLGVWLYYRKWSKKEEQAVPVSKYRRYAKIIGWVMLIVCLSGTFGYFFSKSKVYKPGWLLGQLKAMQDIHDTRVEQRFLTWQVGFNIISRHPILGMGIGRFPGVYFQGLSEIVKLNAEHEYDAVLDYMMGRNANHMHNDYLQLTAESGIIASSILLWIILYFYFCQIKSIRQSQDTNWRLRHIGLTLATVTFLLDALVSFPFYLPANGLLFWILVGLTVVHSQDVIEEKGKQILISRWIKSVGYGLVLIIFVVILSVTVNVVKASYYFKRGVGALMSQSIPEALDYFQKSEQLNPSVGETHFYLGKLYGIRDQLGQAIAEYSLAEQYGMDDIEVYEEPAVFYFRQKEYRKAADKYEQILVLEPSYPEAHKWLGVIYSDYLPDREKAIFHIQKYLASNPWENYRQWFLDKLTELQNSK